jgi:hypothetical protein
MVAPGSLGLNKENEKSLLDPRWATAAKNCVLDNNGRLAARKGWDNQTTTPALSTGGVGFLHEYVQEDGTVIIISGLRTVRSIYSGIDNLGVGGTNITSLKNAADNNWQFVNFNNKVIGIQNSEVLIEWDGAADRFTEIVAASGTLPAGNSGIAAFGRLWITDSDKQTVKYCALLDETDWGGSDAGSINMRHVWTKGTDEVVAIAAISASLVVFGKKHIIIWEDGSGSDIGLDPANIHVVQTIEDTGCVARDSIQNIGEGDMLFLSRHGVQSLGQLVAQKERPATTLTKNYRTDMELLIVDSDATKVRSVYHPEEGFYLVTFPNSRKTVVLDTRRFFIDEEGDKVARVTEWVHTTTPHSFLSRLNGDLLIGFDDVVGKYNGSLDNAATYDIDIYSAWMELDPQLMNRLKILKELTVLAEVGGVEVFTGPTITYKWEFDFNGTKESETATYDDSGSAEYNIAEYNIGEYGGGAAVIRKVIDTQGEGQFIRVGVEATINEYGYALQQMQLYPKLGRMI